MAAKKYNGPKALWLGGRLQNPSKWTAKEKKAHLEQKPSLSKYWKVSAEKGEEVDK